METCAATTDAWTSIQHFGYISFTIHFIDSSFRIKTRTLAIENITGSHSGENLANAIREILRSWSITKKVVGITTDNGYNLSNKNYKTL